MPAYGFKAQFVAPIWVGLNRLMPDLPERYPRAETGIKPKRQTIRAEGKRRHARPGETLQLYTAMRTKQCWKIGDALCKNVRPIRLEFHDGFDVVKIAGEDAFGADGPDIEKLDAFAQRDGFPTWDHLLTFWDENHDRIVSKRGVFDGLLIEWEPFSQDKKGFGT